LGVAEHPAKASGSTSPPWAGSQQLNLCLFGIARGGVRGGAGAVCGAVSLATKNEQMMTEGEDL
jgi:hypothetical protein